MLALLAVAPLLGLVVLSCSWVAEARRTSDGLSVVAESTDELVDLVALEASLQDERNWRGAAATSRELGLTADLLTRTTGVNPFAEEASAIRTTDRLVEAVELPGLTDAVAEAREADDPTISLRLVVDELVAPVVRSEIDETIELAAELQDGGHLVVLARKFEGTNEVRSTFAELRTTFLATFADLDPGQERAVLIDLSAQLAVYEQAIEELQRLVPPDGSIAEPLRDVIDDPARQVFLDVTAQQQAQLGADQGVSDIEAILAAAPITGDLETVEEVNNRHLALVSAAAMVLTDEVETQRAAAQRMAWVVSLGTIMIALVTCGAIVTATRWIVRPLSDLGNTAMVLTQGGTVGLRPASGPEEIRFIHDALSEAISNLERTEQQAIALALGDLDDPSLDEAVPGRFGATVHGAIEQLRSSMTVREEFSDQLAYEAAHDGLTGLANRRASIDVLTDALASQCEDDRPTAVFFIDLDHFKQINDTRGHAAGDDVLRRVADALTSCTRADDVVGRIGGDEFLVISRAVASAEAATAMGDRLLAEITASLDLDDDRVGASIGVALGRRGDDVDALLAEADVAMLEAKHQGRNGIRFFDQELRTRTMDEVSLSTNIRAGLELGEFQLHYQPIIDAVSGQILHFEALIRWDRPGIGRVPPDEYIPFAERSDLVIAIDRWVLDEAANALASRALDDIGIAVNISGRHLANGDLYADLVEVLERTEIDPRKLSVEITESALLGDIDGAIQTLRDIRATGVKVAIDDFGTGFTSLTHLRSLPADVLKIDQSFTSNLDNPDDANLVRLVIQTAHILRLDVVVEGVETMEQARRITMLGADQMQGYLFARPLPLHEVDTSPALDDGRYDEDDDAAQADEGIRSLPTSSPR